MRGDKVDRKTGEWWDENPFSYGLARRSSYRDVGDVSEQASSLEFFDKYLRKVRKHLFDAQGPEEPLAARLIPYEWIPGKRVLDIACGMGWSTVEMARAGAMVTAIDISPKVVAVAQRHVALRGLQDRARIHVMDAQQMSFEGESFDAVHAYGCLMHMPRTEVAIGEIFRVLGPGGRVFGYLYNKNSPTYWWHIWFLRGVVLGGLIRFRGDTLRLVSRYTDGASIGGNPHTKVYTPSEARRLLEAAGFADVRVRPWGPPNLLDSFPVAPLPLGRWLLPKSLKKRLSDRIGFGMFFSAQKPG